MNIKENTPELYQSRINHLEEQLNIVTSNVLREEINKSILYTNAAIAASADLQIFLQTLPERYQSNDKHLDEKLSKINKDLDDLINLDSTANTDLKELSFNILSIEAEGVYSFKDANLIKMKMIFAVGLSWLNLLNYIFSGENNKLTQDKIKFIAKLVGGKIPFIGDTIEIISSIIETINMNTKDAKNSDEFLNNHQNYHIMLDMYISGCINYRLDSNCIMDEIPLLSIEEKNPIIQKHYKDIIDCNHLLFKKR